MGYVPIGQPSLWVEVIAPIGRAFAARRYLIDEMETGRPNLEASVEEDLDWRSA
ncbi:MAG: hypothetical protein U1G07_14350 [Verrucomicrobiota bacterium]